MNAEPIAPHVPESIFSEKILALYEADEVRRITIKNDSDFPKIALDILSERYKAGVYHTPASLRKMLEKDLKHAHKYNPAIDPSIISFMDPAEIAIKMLEIKDFREELESIETHYAKQIEFVEAVENILLCAETQGDTLALSIKHPEYEALGVSVPEVVHLFASRGDYEDEGFMIHGFEEAFSSSKAPKDQTPDQNNASASSNKIDSDSEIKVSEKKSKKSDKTKTKKKDSK